MGIQNSGWFRLLKIVLSISLIALLVATVDAREIWKQVRAMDPWLTAIALILLWLQYPISAWKWQKSLSLHGLEYSFTRLLRFHCIGFFFNSFMPTAVGGDFYRVYKTIPKDHNPLPSVSAVVLDRLIGIFALILLGYFGAIYLLFADTTQFRDLIFYSVTTASGVFVAVLLVWKTKLWSRAWSLVEHTKPAKVLAKNADLIKMHRSKLAPFIGLSLLLQIVAVVTIVALFAAVGLPERLAESAFTAAAAGVASVIPVSINGIGVMEGSFAVAASISGLPYDKAVVVALFLRGFMIVAAALFGVLYAFYRDQPAGALTGEDSESPGERYQP